MDFHLWPKAGFIGKQHFLAKRRCSFMLWQTEKQVGFPLPNNDTFLNIKHTFQDICFLRHNIARNLTPFGSKGKKWCEGICELESRCEEKWLLSPSKMSLCLCQKVTDKVTPRTCKKFPFRLKLRITADDFLMTPAKRQCYSNLIEDHFQGKPCQQTNKWTHGPVWPLNFIRFLWKKN